MSRPYTYLIGWKSLNIYYYGARYCKGCDPSDLWVSYFTSSKVVAQMRESAGEPDLVVVRKIFSSKKKALEHEHKVLRRIGAKSRTDFLNKTNGRDWKQSSEGLYWIRNHEDPKLATKVNYVKNKDDIPTGWFRGFLAPSEKQRAAASRWSSNNRHSEATKQKMREKNSGENNPNHGKKLSSDEIQRLRDSAPKGENNPAFLGYWIVPHGRFSTKKEVVDSSPASVGVDTIIKWCKKRNHMKIDKNTFVHSAYLQHFFDFGQCQGKTFAELGFGFTPK